MNSERLHGQRGIVVLPHDDEKRWKEMAHYLQGFRLTILAPELFTSYFAIRVQEHALPDFVLVKQALPVENAQSILALCHEHGIPCGAIGYGDSDFAESAAYSDRFDFAFSDEDIEDVRIALSVLFGAS